jgi:hypothetical protein
MSGLPSRAIRIAVQRPDELVNKSLLADDVNR